MEENKTTANNIFNDTNTTNNNTGKIIQLDRDTSMNDIISEKLAWPGVKFENRDLGNRIFYDVADLLNLIDQTFTSVSTIYMPATTEIPYRFNVLSSLLDKLDNYYETVYDDPYYDSLVLCNDQLEWIYNKRSTILSKLSQTVNSLQLVWTEMNLIWIRIKASIDKYIDISTKRQIMDFIRSEPEFRNDTGKTIIQYIDIINYLYKNPTSISVANIMNTFNVTEDTGIFVINILENKDAAPYIPIFIIPNKERNGQYSLSSRIYSGISWILRVNRNFAIKGVNNGNKC